MINYLKPSEVGLIGRNLATLSLQCTQDFGIFSQQSIAGLIYPLFSLFLVF